MQNCLQKRSDLLPRSARPIAAIPQVQLVELVVQGGPKMANLSTVEIKAFMPAKDFDLSKRFYKDLGFDLAWEDDHLAEFRHGNARFLLQNFFNEMHAANFMMHLLVEDVDAWWAKVSGDGIPAKYGVSAGALNNHPGGMRDFTLVDPTGVLWRVGQVTKARSGS
jgi:catechol 2,3-dioxygenase-like lactoylglutathione lyase family enzyme